MRHFSKQDVMLTRVSGLRLKSQDPRMRAFELKQAASKLLSLSPILQNAMDEPFCIDDEYRNLPDALTLWLNFLQSGEVFICQARNGELLGVQALLNVRPGRSAYWFAYAAPSKRGSRAIFSAAKELLDYAFKPAPEGLGLLKVKAEIAYENTAATRLMHALGGQPMGILRGDGLFHGMLCDMVIVELYNGSLFAPQGELINVNRGGVDYGERVQSVPEHGSIGDDGSDGEQPAIERAAVPELEYQPASAENLDAVDGGNGRGRKAATARPPRNKRQRVSRARGKG